MNRKILIVALIALLAVFNASCSLEESGKSISEKFELPKLTTWMMPDGKKVDIGGEVVSIIGTHNCNTGFGDSYRCWIFSLVPGDVNPVVLSNGIRETWTTKSGGDDRVYLVRTNGFKVIGK